MADSDSWDADNFEPNEPAAAKKPAAALLDKWEGEDEEEDVKDNWDDEEEDKGGEEKQTEAKVSAKKKINDKIKEKELKQKKQQEELRKRLKEAEAARELTPEEEAAERLRQKQLQEESDLELAREAFGVDSSSSKNSAVSGIDSLNPSSREDFNTLEKLLTEKITQFDKSIHYSTFLESLFRELCISLEVEDLKKINSSLTVLLNEKQKAEKQAAKGKKGKKGKTNLAGGGLKMKMKDDLDDYGGLGGGGGYEQDYEDFM